MACKDGIPCNDSLHLAPNERTLVHDECRVCQLLDNDHSIKRVHYCNVCKAYLCDPCKDDLVRRAKAFTANAIEKIGDSFKNKSASLKDSKNKSSAKKNNGTS